MNNTRLSNILHTFKYVGLLLTVIPLICTIVFYFTYSCLSLLGFLTSYLLFTDLPSSPQPWSSSFQPAALEQQFPTRGPTTYFVRPACIVCKVVSL